MKIRDGCFTYVLQKPFKTMKLDITKLRNARMERQQISSHTSNRRKYLLLAILLIRNFTLALKYSPSNALIDVLVSF